MAHDSRFATGTGHNPSPAHSDRPVPLDYGRPAARPFPGRLMDIWLPLGLLLGGVAIDLGAALLRGYDSPGGYRLQLRFLPLELAGGTLVMAVSMLIASKARAIPLGPIGPAILKLAAVAVVPPAVLLLVQPILSYIPAVGLLPLGGLAGLALEYALYFTLLGTFFDLDESDSKYCLCIIFVVSVAVYVVLLSLGMRRWPW